MSVTVTLPQSQCKPVRVSGPVSHTVRALHHMIQTTLSVFVLYVLLPVPNTSSLWNYKVLSALKY